MQAGELALAGVDHAIVERRASQKLAGLRAGGLLYAPSMYSISVESLYDNGEGRARTCCLIGQRWMEHLWSRTLGTAGNQSHKFNSAPEIETVRSRDRPAQPHQEAF
jgi:hypothetical protein